MKNRYLIYRRKQVYYLEDTETGKQRSLRTRDLQEAESICHSHNEAIRSTLLNRELGKVYLAAADPAATTRTWETVMSAYCTKPVRESTQERNRRAMADTAFNLIRSKPLVETTTDDFLSILKTGGTSTNHYLRRLHNHALGMGWLNWAILPTKRWPKPQPKSRRGITLDEQLKIIESEQNQEHRDFYELLWHTGGSQSDVATLTAEHINWKESVLCFQRKKLKADAEPARFKIGPQLARL